MAGKIWRTCSNSQGTLKEQTDYSNKVYIYIFKFYVYPTNVCNVLLQIRLKWHIAVRQVVVNFLLLMSYLVTISFSFLYLKCFNHYFLMLIMGEVMCATYKCHCLYWPDVGVKEYIGKL